MKKKKLFKSIFTASVIAILIAGNIVQYHRYAELTDQYSRLEVSLNATINEQSEKLNEKDASIKSLTDKLDWSNYICRLAKKELSEMKETVSQNDTY